MSTGDIRDLERMVQGTLRPDLTLLLDAPVVEGLSRARERNTGIVSDRFESERSEFFERVRAAYLARAAAEPSRIAVIDAAQSVEAVGERILALLRERSWIS
jgi:dTMP kinase